MAEIKIETEEDRKEEQGGEKKIKTSETAELQGPPKKKSDAKKKAFSRKGKEKELEALKTALEALEKERDELKEHNLRVHAETENFKKRMIREKEDFARYSNEKVVKELLPIVDNLERAVTHAKEAGESGAFLEGVEMTLNLFGQTLEKIGVTPIASVGETFNPEKHEAVQQIESADHEPNVVVSEFQKGYVLNTRLIRPAMVVVSKSPENK